MGKNLLHLAESLEKRINKIRNESNERIKLTAKKTLGYLIDATPVDTSRAESNWQVSLNNKIPSSAEIEPHFPGSQGSTEFESGDAAYILGENIIDQRESGQSIFISNVVNYIDDLNEGTSPQAEAYFVERIIAISRQYLKNSKIARM